MSRQEPRGAGWAGKSRQQPPAKSRQELPGAAKGREGMAGLAELAGLARLAARFCKKSCPKGPPGAASSRQEPSGAARNL